MLFRSAEDTPLYLKLKALIYLSPASCETLGQRLRDALPDSPILPLLIGALGAVGNEEAQTALLAALQAHANHPQVFSLLIHALGDARAPIVAAENALRQFALDESAQELAGSARLALCSMARKLAASNPEKIGRAHV